MRVAIVGKGGSGKSSVSWLLARQLSKNGAHVLAIDADYNLDFAHNLGWNEEMQTRFLNQSEADFNTYQQMTPKERHLDLPLREKHIYFSSNPADSYTSKYMMPSPQDPHIQLAISGKYHEESLYGNKCAHNYMKMIKYYLPLLQTSRGNYTIIDSVAGTDMVVYGLYLGIDLLVIVVEPTRHSIGVYHQIKSVAHAFNIPVRAILNKYQENEQTKKIENDLGEDLIGKIPLDNAIPLASFDTLQPHTLSAVNQIQKQLESISFDPQQAIVRIKEWRLKRKNEEE
ncbi:MAG: AAA family ATPase [Candidatus Iainarchaeum archaeon]|uniref:AAA family ATPase n=1 Tax=Candidatus Iainarchaeum sp. TaxID=3101447 RepID=A0A7T9DJS0_9ARCH|nr:MAG: AAA family ATPase [Candidatus Diapherotrites archaeon]